MKIAVIGASGLLSSRSLPGGTRTWLSIACLFKQGMEKNPKDNFQTTSLPLDKFDPVIRELFDQWPDALINCAAISLP